MLVGHGVVADRARAVALYQKACVLEPPEGCTAVADLAAESVDPTAYFTTGCASGDNDACGVLARSGVDVAALTKQADDRRAAEDEDDCRSNSDGPACDRAAMRRERAGDIDGARSLFTFACSAGVARSCRAVISAAAAGRGGPRDPDAAATAAVQGCSLGDQACCKAAHGWLRSKRASPALDAARTELQRACTAGVVGACP